jgi:hypothetical protein
VRRPQGWAAWWPFGNPVAPLLAWGAAAAFGLFIGSGLVPGLDSVADFTSFSAGAEPASLARDGSESSAGGTVFPDSAVAGSPSSDSVGSDSAGNDSAGNGPAGDAVSSDDAQLDDWSDLELALGVGPEWEDEP